MTVFALAILCAPAASAAPGMASTRYADVPAGTYVSDQAHTSVVVRLSHMGFSNYTLRFDSVQARFRYDPRAPAMSEVSVTLDPASLDTGSKSLNGQLAGKDWLDAAAYPAITFVSIRIDLGDGVHGTMDGTLTLHGVTRPVGLQVTFNGVGGDIIPLVTRAGFSASAVVKRSDFGITRYADLVGDDLHLQIEIEFTKSLL